MGGTGCLILGWPMQPAASVERFIANPLGRWIAGRSFIVWNWNARLGGMVAWGSPSEVDVEQMFVLVDAYHRAAPSCDVVTDGSRLESLGATAYATLLESMKARRGVYAGVGRHAVVRGGGLMAAIVEGFFAVLAARHSVRVFDDSAAAFAWVRQPEGASARIALERLVDQAVAVRPEIRQLRQFLQSQLRSARFSGAAKALGLSERSLHRVLKAAQTGFRKELATLRVEEARRLLAETARKTDDIARSVGFSSHAHLATQFRRITGESPSEYRAKARATARGASGPRR